MPGRISLTTMHEAKRIDGGEEGIAGICDKEQLLCFAIGLWNKKDPIIYFPHYGSEIPGRGTKIKTSLH